MKKLERINLQLFADDSAGDSNQNAGGGSGDQGQPTTFTQAQLDSIVAGRVAQEKEKFSKANSSLEVQIDKGLSKENIDKLVSESIEKLKTGFRSTSNPDTGTSQQKTESKPDETLEKAQKMIRKATFDSLAIKLGINPDCLDDVALLTHLDGFEINEKGEIDTEAVTTKINEVCEKYPAFSLQSGSYSSGANAGGGAAKNEAGSYGRELGKSIAEQQKTDTKKINELFGFRE